MPDVSEDFDKLIKIVISLILVVIIILISIWFKLTRYVDRYNLVHVDGMHQENDLYHDPYSAHVLSKYRSVSDTPGMSDGPDPESESLIGASRSSDYFNPYANYDRGLISNAHVAPVTFDGMVVGPPPKTSIDKKRGGEGDFAFSEAALSHNLRHGQ